MHALLKIHRSSSGARDCSFGGERPEMVIMQDASQIFEGGVHWFLKAPMLGRSAGRCPACVASAGWGAHQMCSWSMLWLGCASASRTISMLWRSGPAAAATSQQTCCSPTLYCNLSASCMLRERLISPTCQPSKPCLEGVAHHSRLAAACRSSAF